EQDAWLAITRRLTHPPCVIGMPPWIPSFLGIALLPQFECCLPTPTRSFSFEFGTALVCPLRDFPGRAIQRPHRVDSGPSPRSARATRWRRFRPLAEPRSSGKFRPKDAGSYTRG